MSILRMAAAQTGAVAQPGEPGIVDAAVALIDRAHGEGVQFLTFSEVFLSPFFPCRLEERFDHYFMAADDPVVARSPAGPLRRSGQIVA